MVLALAPQYTQRIHTWTNWKIVQLAKVGLHQYDDDGTIYTIYFYDGPEVHLCNIWKDTVPDGVINGGYSQEQNDLDKIDFEDNYKVDSNQAIDKLAASGVKGQSPAKGLGGFAPDPTNNPYQPNADEIVSLYVDGEGSLVTRGAILTDEGSFRDDFTGSALEVDLTGTLTFTNGSRIVTGSETIFTNEISRDHYIKLKSDDTIYWAEIERVPTDTSLLLVDEYEGTSTSGTAHKTKWITETSASNAGTIDVTSSIVRLSSNTHSDSSIIIYRGGDYLPFLITFNASISQRIANQTSFIGVRDDINNPSMYCDIIFTGISNTTIIFRSAWNGDEQSSTITLPVGLNTSQYLRYKIDVSSDYCALLVNGELVTKHENHIPDPYEELILCAGISNSATVTNTDINIDNVFFSNQDQVQISSSFIAPIPVITREDHHSICAKLTTSSTTADQVIISYEVPSGKIFHIIGYRVIASGSSSGIIKIGKNTVTNVPAAPGTVDSNIFRNFVLQSGEDSGEGVFGSIPRRIGASGDTIKVTVTPSSLLSSDWIANLDFVLR